MEEARSRGATVIADSGPPVGRKLPPTLVIDPPDDLRIMQEEIFGPILPIKTYRSLDQAIDYINNRARPLALYLFARDSRTIDSVLTRTVSGGVSVNDPLV